MEPSRDFTLSSVPSWNNFSLGAGLRTKLWYAMAYDSKSAWPSIQLANPIRELIEAETVPQKRIKFFQAIKPTACLVHHGDTGACARAMTEPTRPFLFSTLCARVKRIKNKLTDRMLFSEVAAALNRPLTTTEARGSHQVNQHIINPPSILARSTTDLCIRRARD